MVSMIQVKQGLSAYITQEIIAKMGGWQQWVAGAFVAVAMQRADQIFEKLSKNAVVEALGIVREDGMIDIDTLYGAFKQQASQSGPVAIELPMIGTVTLSAGDIDMIYDHVKRGG